MKKETKKKVFNFALATTIVASVATPLAIVLGKESNLLFNNKKVKQTTNDGQFVGSSYIDENDYTLDLNSALALGGSNRSIRIANPNIARAIPGGYVIVSGDNSNKNQQVVCLDANDPTKQKWVINLSSSNNTNNINVYGIEYSPYSNGTLVVLYSEDDNDQQYETDRYKNEFKFKIFKNIDNNTSTTLSHSKELSFSYANSSSNSQAHIGGRLDTWAISPIYNFSGPVTKFIIYCKERNFTYTNLVNPAYFLLIDISKNNFEKSFKINWAGEENNNEVSNGSSQERKAILSTAAFEKDNNLYIAPLIINFEEQKFKLDIYKSSISDSTFELNNMNNNSNELDWSVGNHQIGASDGNYIAEMIKGSINSFSFKKTHDGGLCISFAINMRPNGENVGQHRSSGIVILELDSNFNIKNTRKKDLFAQNSFTNTDIENELWTGYFSNEVIAKEGIDTTLDSNYLTPFVGIGWSEVENFASTNTDAWFVSLIQNPFDTNNFYTTISNTDSEDYRIYRINDSNYKSWGEWNWEQLGFEQLRSGVPILKYNDSKTNNKPFDRNIFLTKNQTAKAIVINQEGRGSKTDNQASYSYHTRLTKDSFSYSEIPSLTNNLDSITEDKIRTSILPEIKKYLKNVVGNDSNVLILNDSIKFNFPEGKIEFKINVGNKWFDQQGKLQTGTSKTFDISVTGFEKKETKLNTNIHLYGGTSGSYNNGLGKQSYSFIPTEVTSWKANSTWEQTKRFMVIVIKELVVNKFNNQQNHFKNLPSLSDANINQSKATELFNQIFSKFEWIKANNEDGTITVKLGFNKQYVYTNNTNYEVDIVFHGLRQIKKTKLKNIESNSPLQLTDVNQYNIPNEGQSLDQVSNNLNGVQLITEDLLKQKLVEELNKEYSNANANNGLDTGDSGKLSSHLPFVQLLANQNGQLDLNSVSSSTYKLKKENIKLSEFEFFEANGVLKVKVQLLVWNDINSLKHTTSIESSNPNAQETEAPSATWYISGFKHDNVETKFKNDKTWELKDIQNIKIGDFNLEKNRDKIEASLTSYFRTNWKELVDLPFWIEEQSIISDSVTYDISNVIFDSNNYKEATLKVRLKNNMWEKQTNGKVNHNANAQYQEIKITGFLNETPVSIDASKIWTFSNEGVNNQIVLNLGQFENNAFNKYLEDIESKITNYIVEQDKNIGGLTLEQWKDRLGYKYRLENPVIGEKIEFENKESLIQGINNIFLNSPGKLNAFYNESLNLNNGWKFWIKIDSNNYNEWYPSFINSNSQQNQGKGDGVYGLVDTSKITIAFDMENWFNNLSTIRATEIINHNEQQFSGQTIVPPVLLNSNEYGNTLSFVEVQDYLKKMGYKFEYSWNDKDNKLQSSIDQLPNNFTYNSSNPVIKLKISYNSTTKTAPHAYIFGNLNTDLPTEKSKDIVFSLNVKTQIKVDLSWLNYLKFEGNTKNVTNIDKLIENKNQLILKIKEKNKEGKFLESIKNEIDNLDIDILFSINEEPIKNLGLKEDKTWLTLEELKSTLPSSKVNFSSNKVLARLIIRNSDNYQITNEKQIVNEEAFEENATFKVFIHIVDSITEENIKKYLKLKGTQEEYEIENLDTWKSIIPSGLIVEFNSIDNNGQPDETKWNENYKSNPIGSYKRYWLRFKIKSGFILENSNNQIYSNPIELDTSQIVIALKLKSEWLNKIVLTGNLKELEINEELAIQEIKNAQQMIVENIIKIEYQVLGLNQWFDKESFKNKLQELNGSLDIDNWVIRREDIKARFVLDKQISGDKVGSISIDGKVIYDDIENVGNSIIDSKTNQNVKGYINIDKISSIFVANNFELRGTDKSAKLIIKNVVELNKLLSRYASDNIFEILYSNKIDTTSFDSNNKLWTNGTNELQASTNLNGTYSEKQFSLVFKGTTDYEVYYNNEKQENGYILRSPDIKVIIAIEIDNPLNEQKDVKFSFKNKENQQESYYYQNKGGFWVQIGNKTQSNNFQDFDKFISSLTIQEEQKNSLELAYYVSENKLDEQQLKDIHKEEFLYNQTIDETKKYNVWKTLDTSSEGWKKELGLLVNDYVIITIRVKKDKLTNETTSGFIINYDENYIPFQSRVYGYKIDTSKIQINESSIQLKNVGQAELASFALDGYAILNNVSLIEDEDKNYLGVLLKMNYFNDFYKKDDKILVSGSGQVLVKRNDSTYLGNKKYYLDEKGQQLKDSNDQPIEINLDQNGKPTAPIKNNTYTRNIMLEEYGINSFKLPNKESTEIEYNLFQNQIVEFELVSKKGDSEGDDSDYYLDAQNKKISHTFTNIKFPINNDTNIRYEFNSQEFLEKISNPNNVKEVYKNALDPNKEPINGQSKIVQTFSITRKENNKSDIKINTLNEINSQLQSDFNGQVILKATHTSIDGQITEIENGDISKIETLKNGDRFRIEFVSKSNDLIFAQQPTPLIFTISGLYEQPIDEQLLKYLRVKQGGVIDDQGSFNILVDDPNQSNTHSDLKTSLNGYKFLVRVWDKNKTIKHDWTENFISINNLSNGDKVEWKLVSPNGSPLVDSYYNTVANQDKHNLNENKYSFIQINQEGFVNKNISEPQEGIGKNPENQNEYPEKSGLLISGLKSKDDSSYTTISFEEFTRVMNLMNFGYSGINGSGNMISSTKTSDVKLNVLGRNSQTFTLDYLIKNNYISFYYNNDSSSQLNSFNWDQVKDENGNWLTSPGTLSNGDSVRIVYKDPTMSTSYEYYAPVVSGLQNKSDNMSMFSWIGIGLATFATLGIFAFIYIYLRNRKLK